MTCYRTDGQAPTTTKIHRKERDQVRELEYPKIFKIYTAEEDTPRILQKAQISLENPTLDLSEAGSHILYPQKPTLELRKVPLYGNVPDQCTEEVLVL